MDSKVATVLENARLVYTADEVDEALRRLAGEISGSVGEDNPLFLCVMTGGIFFSGRLLPLLNFPLQLDYIHASRYRGHTEGGDLEWLAKPFIPLKDRTVVILDDIFDEGLTLHAIIDYCGRSGAGKVLSAVLVDKIHPRKNSKVKADFVGLRVDDEYVFGCGMDYKEYFRNLPDIWAVTEK